MGYHRAGWDVVGVDIRPQRKFPFRFIEGDALQVAAEMGSEFDAIHASPPCQRYSRATAARGDRLLHPDLVAPTRDLLRRLRLPYVMENVQGAPLESPLTLCGTTFGLEAYDPRSGLTCYLRRHRLFESSVLLFGPGPCRCVEYRAREGYVCGGVYGGGSHDRERAHKIRRGGYTPGPDVGRALMGIEWMGWKALTQSIPPAYTEFLGRQLLEAIRG